MNTAVAPDIEPDRSESGKRPTLVQDLPEETRDAINDRSLDPTQGRKIRSEPYDDPTQGRKIGSDPHDDPTRGR